MPRSVNCILATLAAITLLRPPLTVAQCDPVQIYKVHHLWRIGFNDVEALAGTQVVGDAEDNWTTYVSSVESRNGTPLHSESDYGVGGTDPGEPAVVQWNDAPSSAGTGTYTTSNYHSAWCGPNNPTDTSGDSLTVNQPTIGNLPYDNFLWYFGPGTPGAVPTYGDYYYYQYANLLLNKNCGGGDNCSGTPTWSEYDPYGYISLSCTNCSGSTVRSTADGNCQTSASSVFVSLNGWTVGPEQIGVASPSYIYASSTIHLQHGGGPDYGYTTAIHYKAVSNCSQLMPEAPGHEEFSGLDTNESAVTTGWNQYPQETNFTEFNVDDYTFEDTIWADDSGANPQWVPDPVPPGPSYFTWLTRVDQTWYLGSSSLNTTNGHTVFSGALTYYQDHATAQ